MVIGWDEVQRMKRVEAKANELGFMFATGSYSYGQDVISYICLKPKDDCLPHYSRNAEIFTGTLEEINNWLRGIEWARSYDDMLKLSNGKKRQEREQVERNKQLLKTIKTGKLAEGTVGATDINKVFGTLNDAYEQVMQDYDNLPF